ncbi:MAG: transporter, partial [Flavobacterium sp.]|nr:transporter [Flavobacterium sp.]
MNLPKKIISAFFVLFCSTAFSQYTDVINSNRPGRSMSAFSVGQTVFQTEFGVYGVKEKHDVLLTETSGWG